ncbi:hypothetical protein [Sphingopyxis sp. KK2]|uniref:hypothetical protein n=1 Tax=Sphingopyxis sp. KK2 TaxID=1855727 RepID=UPI0015C2FAB6|nr:hypothetical protein [Sphingopyxis sp. KK2]
MYLPNLLDIGAMKCGTSSLPNDLARHADIFMAEEMDVTRLRATTGMNFAGWQV